MKNRLLTICMMALLMVQLASAFGVTTPFHNNNPLITSPGKVEEVTLMLQNTDEKSDVSLRAQIVEGSDIAEITDESKEYFVPLGVKNVQVNLLIKVPDTMKPGDMRNVKVRFSQFGVGQEGEMVQLNTGIIAITPLVIASPIQDSAPAPPTAASVLVAAVVLALLIAGILIVLRKKKSRGR